MKSITITLTVDYDYDGRENNSSDISDRVAGMVVERAANHNHTVEDGITIKDIRLADENAFSPFQLVRGGYGFSDDSRPSSSKVLVYQEDKNGDIHFVGILNGVQVDDVRNMTDEEFQNILAENNIL